MKRFLLLFTILMVNICAFSQAKSLEVDCQTPGWLSSLITYPQQQTLENLKVSGYINGTDIKFIRELNKNLKLHGIIDLENATIVSGGESYYTANNTNYTTKINEITGYMFAQLDSLQKVILPQGTTAFSGGYQFLNTYVDTLVINGSMESLSIGDGYNNIFWKTRCIYFPEGLKVLDLNYLFHSYSKLSSQELFFPSTIETFTGRNAATADQNIIFHCQSTTPENIKVNGYTNNNYSFFDGGTIYVPKETKSLYEKSIFRKLNIIEEILVDSIKFEFATLSTYAGDEFECKATLFPSNTIYKDVEYEVSDSTLLSIIGDGKFSSKAYGKGYIYAYSPKREFVDSCEIQIYNHTTGINIDKSSASIRIGETIQLFASTLPEKTSDNRVTYSSSDNNIAIVNEDGIVTGIAKGNVSIIVKSVDGNYITKCNIMVLQPVESITLSDHSTSLKVGETKILTASINPSNADNKNIVWTSENPEIVSIENGTIKALRAGVVKIYSTSEDNNNATDHCEVIVTQPTTGISLNYSKYTIEGIGATIQLEATVLPEDATNKNVNWKSSNENVCIVSNGKVVAVGYGTSVIIATTIDGGHMATCTIVVAESTGIDNTYSTKEAIKVFDINGKVSSLDSKGIKIIRFEDGTSLKIVIK